MIAAPPPWRLNFRAWAKLSAKSGGSVTRDASTVADWTSPATVRLMTSSITKQGRPAEAQASHGVSTDYQHRFAEHDAAKEPEPADGPAWRMRPSVMAR